MKGIVTKIFSAEGFGVSFEIEKEVFFAPDIHSRWLEVGYEISFTKVKGIFDGEVKVEQISPDFDVCAKKISVKKYSDKLKKAYEDATKFSEFRETAITELDVQVATKLTEELFGFNYISYYQKQLSKYGVSMFNAHDIFEKYSFKGFPYFKSNPYEFADIVGFNVVMKFVGEIEMSPNEKFYNFIGKYCVDQIYSNGDTVFSSDSIKQMFDDYGVEGDELLYSIGITHAIEKVAERKDEEFIFSERLADEKLLAEKIKKLKKVPLISDEQLAQGIKEAEKKLRLNLSAGQASAVKAVCSTGLSVITGGPGTGKTTVIKTILSVFKKYRKGVVRLAATTGKAAKRMAESCGKDAVTVHRLLEVDPKNMSFVHNKQNPIDADLIIVDEASMMDSKLAISFFEALPADVCVILVGDVDQLPSVDAGKVFGEAILSGKIPTYRLWEVYRQDKSSCINRNALAIKFGDEPDLVGSDFSYSECKSEEEVLREILKIVTPEAQVLCPSHKGVTGTEYLNQILKIKFNPSKNREKFSVGDKVIFTKNNYKIGYLNGDTGRIFEVTDNDLAVTVEGKEILISKKIPDIELAYAITIHKSQGSEYDNIVMPVVSANRAQLNGNLIYTGITRAKKHVHVISENHAMEAGCHKGFTARQCLLHEFL